MKDNKKNRKEPRGENLQQSRLKVLHEDSPYAFREAYVRLRTNLMFGLAATGNSKCKTVAVTSSNPGEGKTTTTVNVAISFAMLGKKTLIIDADMRRPQVGRLLDVSSRNGFSNLLGGFGECYVHSFEGLPLDIITAGNMPPNPSELLAGSRLKKLLEKLSSEYDYIMIDTPPALVVTDAMVLKPYINGYVIVVRSDVSGIEFVKETVNRLKQIDAKICGFILNGHKSKTGIKYGGYGKYSKYSSFDRS